MATVLGSPTFAHPLAGASRSDRACSFRARASAPAIRVLHLWLERARQRRALLRLSDALLEDIGVSRAEARIAGGKPFWRA
jgi:uncharacterized protein YjiS (DUF1127 family)